MWQDIAITIIIYSFVVCTIPLVHQVLRKNARVTLKTAIPTTIGNYALAFVWLTFPEPLYISFTSSILVGTLWLLISIGSWRNKQKNA